MKLGAFVIITVLPWGVHIIAMGDGHIVGGKGKLFSAISFWHRDV